jgi:tetratricopeptide (TPR) repeat protein
VAVALEDDQLDDSDYMVWGNFGSSLSALGYHARALDAYRKAAACAEVLLLLQPNDPHLRSLLGEYYAELDEPERALELTQSALDLAPNDPAIMFRAGFSYEALGDRERALEWIERALERGYPLEEVETAPGLARLRADERYRRLIERTGVAS